MPSLRLLTRTICLSLLLASMCAAKDKVAEKPLYVDPIHDGAADPVVIWNKNTESWFMLYTNRRANFKESRGVQWVHGTHIGIAESKDGGATWQHVGQINTDIDFHPTDQQTHWAPGLIEHQGTYHLYLTYVPGIFEHWKHPRSILHLTSSNLIDWQYQSTLDLATDKVIDAAVIQMPDGKFRLWYNNEKDRKSIYYAESDDLYHWQDKGKATADQPGEGPVVFHWRGKYWMVVDVWDGLGVYSSPDTTNWTRQSGNLLREPGTGPDDTAKGQHADVVVTADDRAYLFYFVHPGQLAAGASGSNYQKRRSVIQVVELKFQDSKITCDREAETLINMQPLLDKSP